MPPCLSAALEHKPDLQMKAMESHVLIATPTLLVGLLRSIAFGWQQEDVAVNAREIQQAGAAVYDQLATFVRLSASFAGFISPTSGLSVICEMNLNLASSHCLLKPVEKSIHWEMRQFAMNRL